MTAAINPVGRIDVLLVRLVEQAVKRAIPPQFAQDVIENVRPVLQREMKRAGIPDKPISPVELVKLLLEGPKRGRRRCTR